MRTNGVCCRDSAGIESVVLKIVLVMGTAIFQVTMGQLICASLFHNHYWYEVCILIEGGVYGDI